MVKKLDLVSMADFDPAPVAKTHTQAGKPLEVSIDDVIPDPNQPRKKFDQEKLQKLADVIKASRLNQPVTVRPMNSDGKYVIGLGERRWRACKIAGLTMLRVQISDEIDYYDQVTENTEQEPLTTMEQARFIAWRVLEGDKKELIAKRLGMRRDTVSQLLALANAPDFIQQLGEATETGARTLYELVLAYKEFPAEVEKFAKAEEITRAGLGRLVEQLRSREAQAKAKQEANAQAEHGAATNPTNEENKPPKQEDDHDKELSVDLEPNLEQASTTAPANDQDAPNTSLPVTTRNTVNVRVHGRAATLAPAGLVHVVYADTGEIAEVDLSTVQILGMGEIENESS